MINYKKNNFLKCIAIDLHLPIYVLRLVSNNKRLTSQMFGYWTILGGQCPPDVRCPL